MDFWLTRYGILHISNSVDWCKWNRIYKKIKKIKIKKPSSSSSRGKQGLWAIFMLYLDIQLFSALPPVKFVSLYTIHSSPSRTSTKYAKTMKVTEHFCWPIALKGYCPFQNNSSTLNIWCTFLKANSQVWDNIWQMKAL